MHVESLPRINKKKSNYLTERIKHKQRRIESSIANSKNNFENKL